MEEAPESKSRHCDEQDPNTSHTSLMSHPTLSLSFVTYKSDLTFPFSINKIHCDEQHLDMSHISLISRPLSLSNVTPVSYRAHFPFLNITYQSDVTPTFSFLMSHTSLM